eukprot:TRINITY_DN10199_c0_g2_i1.p1 TRINITY_DN10199_c0_g2~~TRINITY_DN10199_c0_g2_i1.p1  ORF type:complete len:102 (-),score=8.59 TRINITY_DN10199_c0_g2_i1:488-793(-)
MNKGTSSNLTKHSTNVTTLTKTTATAFNLRTITLQINTIQSERRNTESKETNSPPTPQIHQEESRKILIVHQHTNISIKDRANAITLSALTTHQVFKTNQH